MMIVEGEKALMTGSIGLVDSRKKVIEKEKQF
jgi:hypothetical protein